MQKHWIQHHWNLKVSSTSLLGKRRKSVKHILHMYNSVHPNNLMERSSGTSIAIELGNIVKKEEVSGV